MTLTTGTSPHSTGTLRPARDSDVEAIHRLVTEYAAMGNLLPRARADIERNLAMFSVAEAGGKVVACGALEVFTSELVEIRSLVVDDHARSRGAGRAMVEHLIERARGQGLWRIMALTYVPGFFHRLGFVTVPKETFPEKVWGICVNCYKYHRCDETAVLKVIGA